MYCFFLIKKFLLEIFKNKYIVILTTFLIWMFFFDVNSFFIHEKLNDDIKKMEFELFYLKKILYKENKFLKIINNNPKYIEKIARECFYMKRDNEDLFIIK